MRAEKARSEEDDDGPGEEIRSVVLEDGAEDECERKSCAESEELRRAAATELARGEADENEGDGIDDGGGEAEDLRGNAEERDGDAAAKGSERRISDEAPVEGDERRRGIAARHDGSHSHCRGKKCTTRMSAAKTLRKRASVRSECPQGVGWAWGRPWKEDTRQRAGICSVVSGFMGDS